MTIKQVIVVRKDLNMRRGKEVAQGSHASMAFLTRRLLEHGTKNVELTQQIWSWMSEGITKVCLRVNSEKELMEIHQAAVAAGLESHVVVDAGKTEFNGVPTKTCLAIGPDIDTLIDAITGHLKLY